MFFLVEIINATFLFGVLLKLVGHPDSNSAIMFSFNLDRFIRINFVCHLNACNDIQYMGVCDKGIHVILKSFFNLKTI